MQAGPAEMPGATASPRAPSALLRCEPTDWRRVILTFLTLVLIALSATPPYTSPALALLHSISSLSPFRVLHADAQATILAITPQAAQAGSSAITILGTGFSTGLVLAELSDNAGTAWSSCTSGVWVSANQIKCTYTWAAAKTYVFRVTVTGPSTGTGTTVNAAKLDTYATMTKLWNLELYSNTGTLTPGVASDSPQAVRAIALASTFISSVGGTGLTIRTSGRNDNAAYTINNVEVAVAIPGTSDLQYYKASLTPLTYFNGAVAYPSAISHPASAGIYGSAFSDPIDFCQQAGQSNDLVFVYHVMSGQLSPYFSFTPVAGLVPIVYSVTDATDSTAQTRSSWTGQTGLNSYNNVGSVLWQMYITQPQACNPPVVNSLSPSCILAGIATTITLEGSNFGNATSLMRISYTYGTTDTVCATSTFIDSTHISCTTGTELTSGLIPHFRVFVSGMVTDDTAHTFQVRSNDVLYDVATSLTKTPGSFAISVSTRSFTPSALTLTPSVSPISATSGLTWSPATLDYSSTVKQVTLTVTLAKGAVLPTLSFAKSNTDAANVCPPASIVILVTANFTLTNGCATTYAGQACTWTLTPTFAPSTGSIIVNCAVSAGGGSVSPTSLTFTSAAGKTFVYTAGSAVPSTIHCTLPAQGGNEDYYTAPADASVSVQSPVPINVGALPSTVYTNQAVTLSLTPSASPAASSSVSVNLTTSGCGSLDVSSRTFSSATLQNFVFTAPAAATTCTINFTIPTNLADDFAHFTIQNTLTVVVSPQFNMLVLDRPATLYTNQSVSLRVQITDPSTPSGVTLIPSVPAAASWSPSFFFSDVIVLVSGLLTAPLTSGLLTITFTKSGSDAAKYVLPTTLSINILDRQAFTVAGMPAAVYTGQVLSLTVTANEAPFPWVAADFSCNDTSALLSVSSFNFTNALYTLPVEFTAPSSSGVASLSLHVSPLSGSDYAHFFPLPPSTNIIIRDRATVTISAFPAVVYTNQVISMSVTLAELPSSSITVSLGVDVGSVSPTSLSFSNVQLSRTFTFTAPDAASTVTLNATVLATPGDDFNHYHLVLPVTRALTPQAVITRSGQVASMYPSQTMTFSVASVSAPASGGNLNVSVTLSDGSISPAWILLSAASTPYTFTFTPPAAVGPVLISFHISGVDVAQYRTPDPITVTVLSTHALSLGPLPSTLLTTVPTVAQAALGLTNTAVLNFTCSEAPATDFVQLHVMVSAGSLSASWLTWTVSNWSVPILVQFIAPTQAQVVHFSFSSSGPDVAQYFLPAAQSLIAQAWLDCSPAVVPSDWPYGVGQWFGGGRQTPNMSCSVVGLTTPDVTVNVLLGLSGGDSALLSILPAGVDTPLQWQFASPSSLTHPFRITTPTFLSSAAGQSVTVHVTFALVGGNDVTAGLVLAPSAIAFDLVVHSPAVLQWSVPLPSSLYTSASRLVELTPTEAPLLDGLNVTVACAGTQTLLQFATGRVAPVSFLYHAPSSPGVDTCTFSLSGIDQLHFSPVVDVGVTILQRDDVTLAGLPLSLYTSEAVVFTLQPNNSVAVTVSVTLSMPPPLTNATVNTTSLSLTAGSSAASAPISLTAPTFVPASGQVSLLITLTGADVSQWLDSNRLVNITILPRSGWTFTQPAPAFMTVSNSAVVSLAPIEAPLIGAGVQVNVVCGVFSATLTFPTLSTGAQSFTFPAPGSPTTEICTFAVIGDDSAHFFDPTAVTIPIYAQAAFVLSGAPSSMYAGESVVMSLQPADPARFSTNITLSLSSAFVSTLNVTVLEWLVGSAAAIRFRLTAPASLPSASSVSLQFALSGSDVSQWLPLPSTQVIALQPQSAWNFSAFSPFLRATQTLAFTLAPIDVPSPSVTVTPVLSRASGGSVVGMLVSLTPMTFSNSLPLIVNLTQPAGLAANDTLTITFLVSGADALHYLPPASQIIRLVFVRPIDCTDSPCLSGTCENVPSVQYGTAFTCHCGTGQFGATCGQSVVAAVAVLIAPSQITACTALELDGSQSYGLWPASSVQYYWSIASVSPITAGVTLPADWVLNMTSAALGVSLGTFLDSAHTRLQFSASELASNVTYRFGLWISNGVTSSPIVFADVTKQSDMSAPWLPALQISAPDVLFRPQQSKFLTALLPSSCQSAPSDMLLSFSWRATVVAVTPPASVALVGTVALTSSSRDLTIQPNTLVVGSTYLFELLMTGSSASSPSVTTRRLLVSTGSTSSSTQRTVAASALVASIVGGDREYRLNLPQLTLDASMSYDPDGPADGSSFNTRWQCLFKPTGSTATPAQLPLSASIANQPVLLIPSASLLVNNTYSCTAVITDINFADRNASSSVSVSVLAAPLLPTPLVAILDAPKFVNPSESLILQASVVSMSSTPVYQLQFRWQCTSDPTLNLRDPLMLAGSADSANLAVKSGVLLPSRQYDFTLTVTDPQFGTSATASASVWVNAPPFGGICDVQPRNGSALSTYFVISCSSWQDPQNALPFSYRISYVDEASSSASLLLNSYQLSSSFNTMLPSGTLRLSVSVRDGVGAVGVYSTPFLVPVSLPPLALSDPACFVANMSATLLAQAQQQQDANAQFLILQQLSGILNSAPTNASSDCGGSSSGGSSTQDLRYDLLNSLQSLANSSGPLDLSTALQVSQTLESLTFGPLNNATWQLSQNIVQSTIAALANAGPSSGSTDLASILGATLSNLLVDCSYLDAVADLTQHLLSAQLNGTVAGQAQLLNTTNLQTSASRTDLATGSYVTLANGISVLLTPEALAQFVTGYQTTNASTFGTAASGSTIALDTRVVTFDDRWQVCRNTTGGLSSSLTHIDITLSNGQVVDISQLHTPITFLIPLNADAADRARHPQVDCVGNVVQNFTDAATLGLTCSYWDPRAGNWSSAGCITVGLTADHKAINCSCGHLTEFAILHRRNENAAMCFADQAAVLGLWQYLLFMALYLVSASFSMRQLTHILMTTGCKHYLMTAEHALVFCISIARAINMAIFYEGYKYLSALTISLLSGLPYLFLSWIFTFVIFAWAAIYHSSLSGSREEHPFAAYQSKFILFNALVSSALFAIAILMSSTGNLDTQTMLYQTGIGIISSVDILFSIFFLLYGLLLVRTLTKDFSSPYARKLFTVAVLLSASFAFSSGLLLFSVIDEPLFNQYFNELNALYFSLDLLCLFIILALFAKSVRESVQRHYNDTTNKGSVIRSTVHTTTSTVTSSDDPKKRKKLNRRSDAGMKSMGSMAEPDLAVLDDHSRRGSVSGESAPLHCRVMSSSVAHAREGSIVDPVRIHPHLESTPGSAVHSRGGSLNGPLVVSPDLHDLLTSPTRRTTQPMFSHSKSARSSPLTVDLDRSMGRVTSPLAVKPLPRYTPVGHTTARHSHNPSLSMLTVPRGKHTRALTPDGRHSPDREAPKSRVVFSEPHSDYASDTGDTSGDESTSDSCLPGSVGGSRATSRVGSRVVSRAASRRNSGQLSAQQAMMVTSFSSALPAPLSPNQHYRVPGTLRGGAALERIRSMRAAAAAQIDASASAPTSPSGMASDDQAFAVPPMQTRPSKSRPPTNRSSAQTQVAVSAQAKLMAQAASIMRVADSGESQDPRGRSLPSVHIESPVNALSSPSGRSSAPLPSPSLLSDARSPSNLSPAVAFAASPSHARINLTREFEQESPPPETALPPLHPPLAKPVGRGAVTPVDTQHLPETSPLQAALSPVVESLAESSPAATPVIGSMSLAQPRLDTLAPFVLRTAGGDLTARLSAFPVEAGTGVFGPESVATSAAPSPVPSPPPPPAQPQPVAQPISAYAAGASAARRWSLTDDSKAALTATVVAAHARERSLSQTRDTRRLSESGGAPTVAAVTRDLSPAGKSAALALHSIAAPAVSKASSVDRAAGGHSRSKSRFARPAPTPRTASAGGRSPLQSMAIAITPPPVFNIRAATPPPPLPSHQPQAPAGSLHFPTRAGVDAPNNSSPESLSADLPRSARGRPPRSPVDPAGALALRHVGAPSSRRGPVINARRMAIHASEAEGSSASATLRNPTVPVSSSPSSSAPSSASPASSAAVHARAASPSGSPARSVSREAEEEGTVDTSSAASAGASTAQRPPTAQQRRRNA